MAAARSHANPYLIASAYFGYGRAYTASDPNRALDTFREGLAYVRQHRMPLLEAWIAMDAAVLEATHGDLDQALDLFAACMDSFLQSGATANLAGPFARLVMFFDRTGRPDVAATLYGTAVNPRTYLPQFDGAVDHVRSVLGTATFDACVRAGAAMTVTQAVHYAHHHIQLAR